MEPTCWRVYRSSSADFYNSRWRSSVALRESPDSGMEFGLPHVKIDPAETPFGLAWMEQNVRQSVSYSARARALGNLRDRQRTLAEYWWRTGHSQPRRYR